MTGNLFQQCDDWFEAQAGHFQGLAGPDVTYIERKKRHTRRVLDHAREIMKESGAKPELLEAMEISALLHDVGRFPQLVHKKTYDDSAGFNHGDAGAQLLEESGLLVSLPEETRDVILSAVKYHNRAVVPETVSSDARRVLDVVRNADKLDAIRNNLKYLNPKAPHGKVLKSGLTWHPTNVSPDVVEFALGRQLIPFGSIKWSNDFILFLCCWLYDLHYNYAFRQLRESGNFEQLLGKLPDTEPFLKIKAQLHDDLEWIFRQSCS